VTPFWLWVSMGCMLSALAGFSAVRFGIPALQTAAERPAREPVLVASSAATVVKRPERRPPGSIGPAPRDANAATRRRAAVERPAPAPIVPPPDADKLALWARQVRDGERTFTLATDGCRVTWNRRCKHGHRSWLVHLGLAPD